jgi:hypothetical protein
MSFRLFIYYCALCGGWAAFLVWALVQAGGLRDRGNVYGRTALIAGLLGLLVAAAVGSLDALLSAEQGRRGARVLVCMGVGLLGGLVSGLLGEFFHSRLHGPKFVGWVLVGVFVGASVAVYDLLGTLLGRREMGNARRKALNGVLGGLLGGFVGGLLFELLADRATSLPRASLALGLVVLGLSIGLLIGLAQVILKEAWVRVEAGFRAGRELMLSRDVTTIGRAESCDVGLFGDRAVERLHARILLQNDRYLLADANTPGGTYLNDQPVSGPTPLRSGDVIRVGNSLLRFGERQKRRGERPE